MQEQNPRDPVTAPDQNNSPDPEAFDITLLDMLVCPKTRTPLVYDAEKQELVSLKANLAYPIRHGIPVMLPEEARKYDERSKKPDAP